MSAVIARMRVGAGGVSVVVDRGVHGTWSGEAEFVDADGLARVVGALADAADLSAGTSLRVVVEPPLLQLRRLDTVPPVGPHELVRLLTLQPGRFFRKNGKALVVDATWLPGGRKVALAVAVEEPFALAICEGAAVAGLSVREIAPAFEGAPRSLSLLPPSERETRRMGHVRWARRGLLTAGLLWVALLASVVCRTWVDTRDVEAELARLNGPVEAVLAARREVDGAIAAVAAIERPVEERFRPALTIGTVARALPDSTWLTSVTVRNEGSGTLTGAAPRATFVLARLERLDLLTSLRTDGRAIGETVAGRRVERFTFQFGVEDR